LSNDLVYINSKDKKFTNRASDVFKHTAFSSMGSDLGDINNDGLFDILSTEMLPFSNKRKKAFIAGNTYTTYIFNDRYKYDYQYFRNTLQLNQGLSPDTGIELFSDISMLAGVHETDWSWSALFSDFDNDGFEDIFISNGFRKDISDHDFVDYRKNFGSTITVQELYDQIPEIKIPNFVFKNNGSLRFTDKSDEWGLNIDSFSNGAAVADLDNDGDIDLLVNNIDQEAFLFENRLYNQKGNQNSDSPNYIKIKPEGPVNNKSGIGSIIKVYANDRVHTRKILSNRGYISQSDLNPIIGIGESLKIDSVVILWEESKRTIVRNPAINSVLKINFALSNNQKNNLEDSKTEAIYTKVNPELFNLNQLHPENDFIDFNFQRTLPHKYSQSKTPVVNADFNNDGLEDLYVGGSSRYPSRMFFQNKEGKFQDQNFIFKTDLNLKEEDSDALALDIDNDNDLDLIVTRGTYQFKSGSDLFKHLIFINDGKGKFYKTYQLPIPNISVSCLKTADIDNDGDTDILLGGGVKPQQFPLNEKTYLLINDTKESNKPIFKIASTNFEISKFINYVVSDAVFTDFDQDSKLDLIICGEWQNITFLKNTGNGFIDFSEKTNIKNYRGWWTKIKAVDLDNDGDQDLIAGNYGLNIAFKASSDFPVNLWFNDYDNNGIMDPFISVFGKNDRNKRDEFFYHNRDDMNRQLPLLQKKFTTYLSFGQASATDFFDKQEMKSTQKRSTNFLETCVFENLGNGQFRMIPLPIQCQFAPVNDFLVDDFNKDGFKDIVFVGNDYGMELVQGRADAGNGGILINSGKGLNFNYLNFNLSGFIAPSESRKINYITIGGKKYLMVNEVNKPLRIFASQTNE
jgi:hypothetical protein